MLFFQEGIIDELPHRSTIIFLRMVKNPSKGPAPIQAPYHSSFRPEAIEPFNTLISTRAEMPMRRRGENGICPAYKTDHYTEYAKLLHSLSTYYHDREAFANPDNGSDAIVSVQKTKTS